MKNKRLDIQGLRALAVILVVAFHLWPDRIGGGYVGVDVFFVISGFLITAHLLKEVETTGTVKLTRFWARRIRRLLPAAFTVLAASLLAAFIILPKSVLQQTLYEIGASAIDLQNWILAGSSVDYLAADNAPSLVQHFWSLSVEEQFYIFWPLLILAALWIKARMRRGDGTNRRMVALALLLVFVASLTFSIYETTVSQASAYFVTPTRAWEFAAGGLLVFIPQLAVGRFAAPFDGACRAAASWVGLAMILAAAFLFDADTQFPGYMALVPVVGTMLLIYIGDNESPWSASYLARFGPTQFLGDISYSVYLWHWPLIVVYPYLRGSEMQLNGAIVVLIATIALACATKVLVEDPFRTRPQFSGRRPAYLLAAAGMAVFITAAATGAVYVDSLYSQARTPQPPFGSSTELTAKINSTLSSAKWALADQLPGKEAQAKEWVEDGCLNVNEKDIDRCTYGDPEGSKTVVVIGDSIATSFMPAIRGALDSRGWKIIPLTYGQCPAADVAVTEWGESQEYERCRTHRSWAAHKALSLNPDLIILASAGDSSYSRLLSRNTGAAADSEWRSGILSFTKQVVTKTTEVVVLGSPVFANCTTKFGESPNSCNEAARPVSTDRVAAESHAVTEAGAQYVDTRSWMCNRDLTLCPEQIGSTLVRADGAHLSEGFSKRLSDVMREALLS